MTPQAQGYKLPQALITRADLARMLREIETVDGDLGAQKVRGKEGNDRTLPVLSRALSDFLELNQQDLLDDHARVTLTENLRKLKDAAPVVHMTFAVEADPESLQQLVVWFRDNAHPQALLSVGMQPALVGGVYLRTPNHVHDFSMRSLFQSKRGIVAAKLEELSQ